MSTENLTFIKFSQIQEEYSAFLDSLIESKNSKLFTNSGKEHAEVLMFKIFQCTEESLKIYARGLFPDLTNSQIYREGLKGYVSKGGKLDVLLETDEMKVDTNSTINFLLGQNNPKISFRVLNAGSLNQIQSHFIGYEHCNFCVGDNNKFRYETNAEKFEAIASFNEPKLAGKFSQIFSKYFADDFSHTISQ